MRLGVLATHPIQYHAPLYRALAERLDLEVFFAHRQTAEGQAAAGFGVAFEWDVPLTDGYRHTFLDNRARHPSTDTFSGTDTPEIGARIREGHFDAFLVNGWYTRSYWQAMRACWQTGTPLLVRGDSHLGTARSNLLRVAKWAAYRAFVPRFDGYLVVGQRAREYLLHYGADPARMTPVPHFVDTAFFTSHAAAVDRSVERARLGADEASLVLLFVGKFIPKKRPGDVIAAAAQLRVSGAARRRDVRVVLVGSGPLDAELRALAARLDVPTHFAGFQNQTQLPLWYAAADMLVLPSDGGETWGLVVNEAFACRVPAVVSDAAGCTPDLVVDVEGPERTGAAFPSGDVAALAAAVARVAPHLGTPALEAAVLRRSAAHALDVAVEGTMAAVARVCRPSTVASDFHVSA